MDKYEPRIFYYYYFVVHVLNTNLCMLIMLSYSIYFNCGSVLIVEECEITMD